MKPQLASPSLDVLPDGLALVHGKIVHHHYLPALARRSRAGSADGTGGGGGTGTSRGIILLGAFPSYGVLAEWGGQRRPKSDATPLRRETRGPTDLLE